MSIEPLEAPPPATGGRRPIEGLVEADIDPDSSDAPGGGLPSRGGTRRARQVVRVIRRVELWSVLKVSAVLYVCLWLVLTVAGVILWQLAHATGTLDNLEDFIATALADTSFTIDGGRILLSSLAGGVVIVFAGTGLTVLLAVLFNLVSELTGGVRLAVVELETAVPVEPEAGSPDGRALR